METLSGLLLRKLRKAYDYQTLMSRAAKKRAPLFKKKFCREIIESEVLLQEYADRNLEQMTHRYTS